MLWGGTNPPTATEDKRTYLASVLAFAAPTREAGVDVELNNHGLWPPAARRAPPAARRQGPPGPCGQSLAAADGPWSATETLSCAEEVSTVPAGAPARAASVTTLRSPR